MYKLTVDGKTMVGCNQDAWRNTTKIWFVEARSESEYGVCITGSRQVGPHRFAPQSAMNDQGLAFSRLATYHPRIAKDLSDKKVIKDEVHYLTDILQKCANIQEVEQYIEQYDYSYFIDDVYIYVDRSGDYLIVEPYQMIKGNDPNYVLANFCPSITPYETRRNQVRYKDGVDYLEANPPIASLDYCKDLSDTMSVCRSRNGDGTLLTSIWDTEKLIVNLFFYHDYDRTVSFDIKEELLKGNHMYTIPELFPENAEFEHYLNYKTPFNFAWIRKLLAMTGGILAILSIVYIISYFRKKSKSRFDKVKLCFAGLNLILFGYMIVLTTHIGIYYFDVPYNDPSSTWVSMSSYIPLILLIFILPLTYFNTAFIKRSLSTFWMKSTLILNNLIYAIMIFAFMYWGLYGL